MTTPLYQTTPYPTQEEIEEYRPRRVSVRSCSVTGQCSVCLDLFTVDLYRIGDTTHVTETKYTKWYPRRTQHQLVHRPDYCNGDIKLYGSIEGLLPPRKVTHNLAG